MKAIKVETKDIDGETWFKFNKKLDEIKYFYGNLITILLMVVLIVVGGVIAWTVFGHLSELQAHPCALCEKAGYLCMEKLAP